MERHSRVTWLSGRVLIGLPAKKNMHEIHVGNMVGEMHLRLA